MLTFICTGKPKNLCDSLYCEICFIEVVCSQTHSISKVCLYTHYNFVVHPITACQWSFCSLLSLSPHPTYSIHHISSVQSLSRVWLLWPHELQHARFPCLSPSPRACSYSCPLSRRCHPTISSSIIPFSSWLQSFPASGSFPMSQFFTSEA